MQFSHFAENLQGSDNMKAAMTTYGTLPRKTKDEDDEQLPTVERSFLTRLFELDTRRTTVWKEVRAGITTFLTMGYILVLNPEILAFPHSELSKSDVVVATALCAATGTFITGVLGNLPLGCAPGLGLSAYLSYGLIEGNNIPWEEGFALCYYSGLFLLIFGIFGLSEKVMQVIPTTIKLATVAGMGMLLSFIALQQVQVVIASKDNLVELGSLYHWKVFVSFLCLILLATLTYHRVKAATLISIVLATLIINLFSSSSTNVPIDDTGVHATFIAAALKPESITSIHASNSIPALLSFILVALFDVSGVVFGCAKLGGLFDKENKRVPGIKMAFIGTAIGTMLGSVLGCSPVIVHIESVAGIRDGGRTGLTAVTVSILFILSIPFASLVSKIPVFATAPVLLMIGAEMMAATKEINWHSMFHALPAFLTIVIMPMTFSIPNGIFFGTVTYSLLYCSTCAFVKDDVEEISGDESDKELQTGKDTSFLGTEQYTRTPSLLLREEDYENKLSV